MKEALKKAAEMLQTSVEDLSRYPEDVQQQMIEAAKEPTDDTFEALQQIWQDAFLNSEMQEVSRVSGVSMQTIHALPTSVKVQLTYLLAENPNDSVALNRCITDYIATAALSDIAMLLNQPLSEMQTLPADRQRELCGAFDMLYGTYEQADLIVELRDMYEAMRKGIAS